MNNDWWKDRVVYQIYPMSFKDSNDDGIGDIQGIIEKLSYLKELGVGIIWLNPMYKSPMVDNGYDISNYYEIDEMYGSMEDFEFLLENAHELDIKVIMDLVVNHTSDQHPWFVESKKSSNNPYSDYYIWRKPDSNGGPPNNWKGSFGGDAWTYCESRGEYYLHLFAKEMPDLNWENPKVRSGIYEMMKFWLDKGLDGFRLDVISLISKKQNFPDAPADFKATKNYYYGASNGPRVHEYLQEMNREVLSKYRTFTVGETPNTSSKQALLYSNPERKELNMVFQFDHMHLDYGKFGKFSDIRFKLSDLRQVLSKWQYDLKDGWNSLYWSNHDQPRAVTRFGHEGEYRVESAKMLATLLHMMKGTPFIYQGEEIGMKNTPYKSLKQYKDIETLNEIEKMTNKGANNDYIKKTCYLKSRDNARTPIPWNGRMIDGYGFSDSEPWIDYSGDNELINVEKALEDEKSVFYYYQKLIQLRKNYDVIVNGEYELLDETDSDVYFYSRRTEKETIYVVCSFSKYKVNYDVSDDIDVEGAKLILSNYEDSDSSMMRRIELRPYEALVYYVGCEE